jgi:hypothetical protein
MLVHVPDHPVEATLTDYDIRIDQKEILPSTGSDADVIGLRKPMILSIPNDFHGGKTGPHSLRGPVRRGIVDNDDLHRVTGALAQNGFNAFQEIGLRIPAHDDHGYLHGHIHPESALVSGVRVSRSFAVSPTPSAVEVHVMPPATAFPSSKSPTDRGESIEHS